MNKRLMLCIVTLLISVFSQTVFSAQAVPQRIITLSPHLAELVYSLGSGEQLIAVIEHSDFPEAVKNIPRIGTASGLDLERILSIKPDLILAWQGGTRDTDVRKLKELGMRVISIKSESLQDIPESIRVLGEILKQPQRSSEMIAEFNVRLRAISEQYRNNATHRSFIEISSQPLMGLTNRHPFSTGLELCGLNNIFSDMDKAAIVTDLESILSRDVAVIMLRHKPEGNEFSQREKFYRISDSNVFFVSFDEDRAFRQTPRLLDAVDEVCGAVYGVN
jgi:ABC-type Fe3+-hydroxamate transport system substrate-binding protein